MTDRDDAILAGNDFRESVLEKADAWKGTAPLWHGWAIMDAFLAGIEWARAHGEQLRPEK